LHIAGGDWQIPVNHLSWCSSIQNLHSYSTLASILYPYITFLSSPGTVPPVKLQMPVFFPLSPSFSFLNCASVSAVLRNLYFLSLSQFSLEFPSPLPTWTLLVTSALLSPPILASLKLSYCFIYSSKFWTITKYFMFKQLWIKL
jgi:hypothetical protein